MPLFSENPGVAGSIPASWFSAGTANNAGGIIANTLWITGFWLDVSLKFSNISVNVNAADAVNSYDLGVYSIAGTLLGHTGAMTLPSTGVHAFALTGGALILAPGGYIFAFTGNATTATLHYDGDRLTLLNNSIFGSSSGGVLPNTITAQAITPANGGLLFALSA